MRSTNPPARRSVARFIPLVLAVAAIGSYAIVNSDAQARPADVVAQAALDEAGVVAIFDLANTADIESGAVGAQKATDKEVKDFGKMLSDVHTQVRQKGRDLAKKLGVTPVMPAGNTMAADHAAAMAKLKGLKGAAFNKAFLEHEQAYHAAVLDAVKTTLLPAIKNQELKDFVVSLAPAFEAHRQAAANLLAKQK